MRVLWICNKMLPRIGDKLNIPTGNKEGWLNTLSDNLIKKCEEDIENGVPKKDCLVLGVAFPVAKDKSSYHENVDGLEAYGFYEDTDHPEIYDSKLEDRFRNIFASFKPDMIHIFGTEFPHTLAATKAFRNPSHTLIGIQGLCSEYALGFKDGIPEKIVNRYTLRDFLKKDNIELQYQKFVKRGSYERQAIKLAGHIAGRTDWDYEATRKVNPDSQYHVLHETLRSTFGTPSGWDYDNCSRHTIFVSQGDYPIKGLHILLRALPKVVEEYPDLELRVSGNCILDINGSPEGVTYKNAKKNLKKTILISSYGKYLKDLIAEGNLQTRVCFLGSINAEAVKKELLNAGLYCMPSIMENSSNALGEAMLMGVPVVAANTGGTASMIEPDTEGVLYECLDEVALADSIIKVFKAYDNPKESGSADIRRQVVKAKEHAMRSHDGDKNTSELISLYKEICE